MPFHASGSSGWRLGHKRGAVACLRITWRGSNGGCTDAATSSENAAAATVRRKLGQQRDDGAYVDVLRADDGAASQRNRKKSSLGLNGSPSRMRPNTSPNKSSP